MSWQIVVLILGLGAELVAAISVGAWITREKVKDGEAPPNP